MASAISLEFLKELNLGAQAQAVCTGSEWFGSKTSGAYESFSPVDGKKIGSVFKASRDDYEKLIGITEKAFIEWRKIPGPKRGDVVRQIGDALREKKAALGALVAYEMGKSLQEGLGEV